MSASQGPLVLKSFKMTKSFLDQLEDLHINFRIKPKYSGHNETMIDTNTFMEKIDYINQKHQSKKLLKNLNY